MTAPGTGFSPPGTVIAPPGTELAPSGTGPVPPGTGMTAPGIGITPPWRSPTLGEGRKPSINPLHILSMEALRVVMKLKVA